MRRFVAAVVLFIASTASAADLRVTIVGSRDDSRVAAVREAVVFWNHELRSLGVARRFGPVAFSETPLPHGRRGLEALRKGEGDVVIALTNGEFASFTLPADRGGAALIALRRGDVPPLSQPNVARNVIAHELGHVLGLEHNADPAKLMCGRPAACRPDSFISSQPHFFALTNAEKRQLRRR